MDVVVVGIGRDVGRSWALTSLSSALARRSQSPPLNCPVTSLKTGVRGRNLNFVNDLAS